MDLHFECIENTQKFIKKVKETKELDKKVQLDYVWS